MNRILLFIGFVILTCAAKAQFTAVASGDWEDCNTWGTCPGSVAGTDFPGVNDDVTIPGPFTVSVSDNNDNGGPNVQPNDFAGACDPNNFEGCTANTFHIGGNVTVESGGTFFSTVPVLIESTFVVEGTYTLSDNIDDTYVLGFLDVQPGGTFTTGDSFVVSGSGRSNINSSGTLNIGDDLWIDGDNSFICGTGTYNVNSTAAGNGTTGNESLRIANGDGSALEQVCTETTITCEDADCCAGACEDINPFADNPPDDGQLLPNEGPGRPSSSTVLPVELISFNAEIDGGRVILDWVTASEKDNEKFIVQRSTDGSGFDSIGEVAGNGDSNQIIHYQFEDPNPLIGVNYYRLKQVDFDGNFELSRTIIVFNGEETALRIFPNPASKMLYLVPGNKYERTITMITISSTSGQVLTKWESFMDANGEQIDFDLNPGVYFLRLQNSVFQELRKIVVQ